MEQTLITPLIKVFFDGSCPLCVAEIDFIRAKDVHKKFEFIDASHTNFDPCDFQLHGISRQDCLRELIAQAPDGTVYRALATFRLMYATIDLAQVAAWTNWPLLNKLMDVLYRWFANNRYWLPKSWMVSIFEQKTKQALEKQADKAFAQRQTCHDGVCEMKQTSESTHQQGVK